MNFYFFVKMKEKKDQKMISEKTMACAIKSEQLIIHKKLKKKY